MNKKKLAKYLGLSLSLMLLISPLAGCGGKGSSSKADKVVKFNLGGEPKSIDPAKNNAIDGGNVIMNAFEGLYRLDEKDQPVPAIAEKTDISKDGLTYTFHLRKDAKWSDGKPVTAHDFEYSWKRVLKPETAAEYAYYLYYIKNARGYNESKSAPADKTPGVKPATADEVGVKAIDDNTLKVELEAPTKYFLGLMAFPTYFPVRKDIVEKNPDDWTLKGDTYVCNGPFKLKEWKPKDSIVFVKNENYRKVNDIKLDGIVYKMIDKETSSLSAFKTGDLDMIEKPPALEIPKLLKDGTAKEYSTLGTYYYSINTSDKATQKVLKDARVRKALSYALNRKDLVEQIVKLGKPATSIVPPGIKDDNGKDFNSKQYYKPEGDIAMAKKLLAEAGYPDGKGFPKVTLLYNNGEAHQSIAQAVQEMWRKNLGVNIELKNQEWKVFQTTRTNKDFDIAREGWIGDYIDPITFLDIWITGTGNNNCGFKNAKYDKLIQESKGEMNNDKRVAKMHEAEDILMDEMPIIPLYYYTEVVCMKDYVKGVYKSLLGFVLFDNAYIEKK